MTSTFEDQLREDLHAAAGHTAYPSIDPTEVIGDGRRFVRRRRRQQAVTAVAAVAVLAVGGLIATDQGRTTTAPPAGPSSITSAAPVSRALLNLSDDGLGRFIAEWTPGTDGVVIVDAADDSRPTVARLLLPAAGHQVTAAVLPERGSVIALLPADSHVLSLDTTAASKNGGYQSDTKNLGEDLVLYGARFDDPARAQGTARIMWVDGTDMVWDGDVPLPTARFDAPGGAVVPQLVWVDAAHDIWGTSDPVGGSLTERPLETWSLDSMGSFAPPDSQHPGRGTFIITGLLPYADVSDLTATWARGVTVVSPLQGRQLTSGDRTNLTAFHAAVTTEGELPEPLLRSVTFTGPDGKKHSHSFVKGAGS
jgi:hypothetical protein